MRYIGMRLSLVKKIILIYYVTKERLEFTGSGKRGNDGRWTRREAFRTDKLSGICNHSTHFLTGGWSQNEVDVKTRLWTHELKELEEWAILRLTKNVLFYLFQRITPETVLKTFQG
jgi:hypothetical protein